MSHTSPDYTQLEGYAYSHDNGANDTYVTSGESGGEVGNSGDNPHARINQESGDATQGRTRPAPLTYNASQPKEKAPYQRNEWVYWASNLSYIGFAMLGGTYLSTKTPFVPLSILLFITGTLCIILSCLMFVVSPIILLGEWGLKQLGM